MRKKQCTLFVLAVFFLMLMAQPALAASVPQLSASADAASLNKGETIKVKINLKNNPNISTLGLTVNYDADMFQYSDCNWSNVLGGNDMKMASDAQGSVNLSLVCDKSYQDNGTVATVSFQAKEDVTKVDMTLQLREMSDENLSNIENCKVTKTVNVPEDAAKDNSNKDTGSDDEEEEKKNVVKKNASKQASQTPVKEAKSTSPAKTATAASEKLDESYKTGVRVGEDLLFVIAAVCGLMAVIFWLERKKDTWS